MKKKSIFGTDGIRGIAGSELTPTLALALGLSAGSVLGVEGGKAIIGKDSRVSGDMLSLALASGLMAIGIDVYDAFILPTPAISLLTRELGFDFGVVVSASHNPVEDNGFKFFESKGFKIDQKLEDEIEVLLNVTDTIQIKEGIHVGRRKEYNDAKDFYIDYLLGLFPINLHNMKIIVDTAYGATSLVVPQLFSRLGADVVTLHGEPDGNLINVDCGSTYPGKLQEFVMELNADIGLAYDGDGDRVIAIDEKGEIVNGDQILGIMANSFLKEGRMKEPVVVGTILTNQRLEYFLSELGGKLIRVDVGDRNIIHAMNKNELILGGERSGHIIFRDRSPSGDGIITSLEILSLMKKESASLYNLKTIFEEYPQIEKNIPSKKKHELLSHPLLIEKLNLLNESFGKQGRIVVRASGTEPVVRVMVEFKERETAQRIINEITDLIIKTEES